MNLFYFFISTLTLLIMPVEKYDIQVTITGIKSMEGELALGVFTTDEQFQKEEPVIGFIFDKSDVKDGVLTVTIPLEAGKYGISLLDDKNGNKKMDYNFLGIPKEGFGFSNFYLTGLSKPTLDDFAFEVDESTTQQPIKIKIKYML